MMIKMKGQGLVEILMTLLIVAGSVLALLRLHSYLLYSNNLTYQQATAFQLAKSEIESLRDYSALTGTNSYANIASGSSTVTGVSATYSMVWTVTSYTNPNYKTIDVTVSWTDRFGTSQSIRLISNIAQTDPNYSASIMAL